MPTQKTTASMHNTIPHKSSHQKFNRYLTISVGAGFVATGRSDAEVVTININSTGNPAQSIAGSNGGVSSGNFKTVSQWPNSAGSFLLVTNNYFGKTGLAGYQTNLQFAFNGGNASIKNFSASALINSTSSFTSNSVQSAFKYYGQAVPDFGANNYVGFRFGNTGSYYYGWLETTWNQTSFQILSGAYENQVNTAILAGSFVSVPEPGTLTLGSLALLAGGGAAIRRYRKQRQNQSGATAEASDPVTPIA